MPASRKLYEDVAESFRIANRQAENHLEKEVIRQLMNNIALDFTKDNPRFDRNKFKEACTRDYPTGFRP